MKARKITTNQELAPSELALGADGSVYHLALHPKEISDTVILVGDPGRVDTIRQHLDNVEFERQHREFVSCTGLYKGKRITALATGIGTDNIDIVVNELDALANIDLEKRKIISKPKSLRLVRIGTCGTFREQIEPGSVVVSAYALGFDPVAKFYDLVPEDEEAGLLQQIHLFRNWPRNLPIPYAAKGDKSLLKLLSPLGIPGITLTAPGFYGPQGRSLRLAGRGQSLMDPLKQLKYNDLECLNWEMETSALYALSGGFGHKALTCCLVIANRANHTFLADYQTKMNDLIVQVLDRLTA